MVIEEMPRVGEKRDCPQKRKRRRVAGPIPAIQQRANLEHDIVEYLSGNTSLYFQGEYPVRRALQPLVGVLFTQLGSVFAHDFVPNEDRIGFSHVVLEGKAIDQETPVVVGQLGVNKKGLHVVQSVFFRRQRIG